MESYVGVFFFGHSKDEGGFGQEDRLIVFVVGDIGLSVLHKVLQICIFSAHPTGFVNAAWLKPAFGAIFVFQAVLQNLKLKFAHGTHKFSVAQLLHK